MAAHAPVRALRIVVRWRPVRLVLDTNTFIAAYWSPRSASARVVKACEEGEVRLLVSEPVCREVTRILRQARTSPSYQERIARLLDSAEAVTPQKGPRWVPADPDDDKFVACALGGGADYLVSSDEHLLALGVVDGVCVLTPGRFHRRCLAE